MPISPERTRLAGQLSRLAAEENNEEAAAELVRRAELIERSDTLKRYKLEDGH